MKKISLLFIIIIVFGGNLLADNSQKIIRISEGKQNAKITIINNVNIH